MKTVDAVIETPQGSRNKYKYDEASGLFKLSRVLPSGSVYPFSFGFVPKTLSEDGDPLDVLVVADEPVPVGCVVTSRLIGVLEAEQDKGEGPKRNDRLIAVAAQSRDHDTLTSYQQINPKLRQEIEGFFVSTHEQVGEKFRILGWQGPQAARGTLDRAIARRQDHKERTMDATELLRHDHAFVKTMFKNYQEMEPGDAGRKKTLFKQIKVELDAHSEIEEKLFYPAVRDARTSEAERLIREAYEEHRLVKQLLRELSKGRPGSEEFDAKFKVLKENVLHHAKEEENDIFAVARETLSTEDLERLGREMAQRKHELGGRLHDVEPLARKARRVISRMGRAIGLSTPGPRRRRS